MPNGPFDLACPKRWQYTFCNQEYKSCDLTLCPTLPDRSFGISIN